MKGSQNDAKAYAVKLLSYRSRSRKEMLERLGRKGFNSDKAENAVNYLENIGLISDEKLASDLFRYSVERKSLGKKGIKNFLVKRGIDRELAEKTISAHTGEMEENLAREFVERKIRAMKKYPQMVIKRRLMGMLQRRGFSADVIRKVLIFKE